jgi:LPXTG-motif cell wall-anchored protein
VQILAGSSDSTVSATASGTWAKKGAIPAVTAEVDCAKSGVDVTATNEGDEDFTFTLAGKEHTVAPGKSETVTVPVAEDQSYKITISGPNGFEKTFEGVLDCKTAGSGSSGGGSSATPSSAPSAASVGGSSTSTTGDLAETGSSSATPVIAGAAIALVVIGGGAVFLLRKKKPATPAE